MFTLHDCDPSRGATCLAGDQAAPRSGLQSRRILIVEDNPLSMKLFSDLLEAHGYATLKASNGREALRLAGSGDPDLILMDVQLPDLSGLDVIRLLKGAPATGGIAIVAMTASAMPGIEREAAAAGCDGFIEKPINIDGFLRVIARHSSARFG